METLIKNNVLQDFDDSIVKYPTNTAIEQGENKITYQGLNKHSDELASVIDYIGANNKIVIVLMPPSIQLISAILSTFKAGAIFLPIDISFSKKRLADIFTNTFDGIIITSDHQAGYISELSAELDFKIDSLITLKDDLSIKMYNEGKLIETTTGADERIPLNRSADDSSYIFYTSGSTGSGKAILGRHSSLHHFINWEIREFKVDSTFRISQLTQVTFDPFLRDVFVALCSGATLCIPQDELRSDPSRLLKWLNDQNITLIHSVPTLFRILTNELSLLPAGALPFSTLKYVLLAGEMLYYKDIYNWQNIAGTGTQFVNLYGPTETTLAKLFYRIPGNAENSLKVIPVGMPIIDTVAAIINDGHICRMGEIGEVYIKTKFPSKGYYRNKELTDAVFIQNPLGKTADDIVYKTGDLGRYLPDKNIELVGRTDSQVKVNGIRIELAEIELAMQQIKDITGAIVKVFVNEDQHSQMIGYYTGKRIETSEYKKELKKILNEQIIPSALVHLEKFPTNLNGKIDRNQLAFPNEVQTDIKFEPPVGEIETALVRVWQSILGDIKISRNSSFFNIGGNSLKALQLISRLYKEFSINPKAVDVFVHQTIASQASLLAELRPELANAGTAFEEQNRDEFEYELSHQQKRAYKEIQDNHLGNLLYHTGIGKDIPASKLKEAIINLVKSLDIFRTEFRDVNGHIKARILDPEKIDFNNIEIKHDDFKNVHDGLKLITYDLGRYPLFNFVILEEKDGNIRVFFKASHIIFDGFSFNLLIEYIKNQLFGVKQENYQYSDFAKWQNKTNPDNAKLIYWKNVFGNSPFSFSYPIDKQKVKGLLSITSIHTYKDKNIDLRYFMSCFAKWIRHTMGVTDFYILYPTLGRTLTNPEFYKCIGFFANLLILKVDTNTNVEKQEFDEELKEVLHRNLVNEIPYEENLRLNNLKTQFPYYINVQYNDEIMNAVPENEVTLIDPEKSYLTTFQAGIFVKISKTHVRFNLEFDSNHISIENAQKLINMLQK